MSRPRIVAVEWLDAAALTVGWVDLADARSKDGRALVLVRSVGYVVTSDKRVIVLCQSFHGDRVGGVQIIPRTAIVKRRVLK